MSEEQKVLMYKGHPLMRKDNLIYYGSMADSHIVMMQIMETKNINGIDIATRVSVQLQLGYRLAKAVAYYSFNVFFTQRVRAFYHPHKLGGKVRVLAEPKQESAHVGVAFGRAVSFCFDNIQNRILQRI